MKDVFISDSIVYVGVDDKNIDLFENQYVVPNGVSYNSYVILDDKITIMDTVDRRGTEGWLANLKETLGDKKPYYVVVSHLEPDHAGNLKTLLDLYPDIKVIVYQIRNDFFGEMITVSGLLTGTDLKAQLTGQELGDMLLLSSNVLRMGEEVFLDDVTLTELENALQVPIHIVKSDGQCLYDGMLGNV